MGVDLAGSGEIDVVVGEQRAAKRFVDAP